MTKIDNYYLDLIKTNKLEQEERNRIYEMYRDMIFSFEENRLKVANSFFITLYHSGYLINVRDEKIEELLNDNSINS